MKPVLMIHEFKEEFFDLPLEDYILTFDDGLYTQFKYLQELKAIDTPKIFFVSSNLLRGSLDPFNDEFIACSDAHKKAFDGNLENYMSWDEVLEIHNTDGCEIGGHGHNHLKLWEMKSTRDRYNSISEDTKAMVKTFKSKGIKLQSYCYPYNYNDDLLSGVVKRNKIERLYGVERIAIEKLIEELI